MKLALILFSVLTSLSLWFGAQWPSPGICRGRSLSIALLPGPEMTGPPLPLRFGGTRPLPSPPLNGFTTDKPFRLVIKTREEFSDFWKSYTAPMPPDNRPAQPEIDFSKEMVVVAAMGQKPSCCHFTFIDGACEVDGQLEVSVSNVDDNSCLGGFTVLNFPADAVRLPKTDLPVVFREAQIPCTEWAKFFRMK